MFKNFDGLSRRNVIQGLCGTAVLATIGKPAEAAVKITASKATSTSTLSKLSGLRPIVEPKGKFFGAALMSHYLSEADYMTAVRADCNMIVPEAELKMSWLRPTETTYNWAGYDKLAAFAIKNRMKMRGHTLIWHEAMPQWAKDRLNAKRDPLGLLHSHIATVMERTKGMIKDWDVVNEAIDHDSPRSDMLRVTPWLNAIGPSYIAEAYRAAYAADPTCKLVYNEYSLEYPNTWVDGLRRKGTLALLTNLKKSGVPIHALGLQAHLAAHLSFATDSFVAFLKEVKNLGLEIMVTELDVNTAGLRVDNATKARLAGEHVQRYFDIIRAVTNVKTVLTWGHSSRHSWLLEQNSASYGGLPLDNYMKRLPMWNAIYDGWAKFS